MGGVLVGQWFAGAGHDDNGFLRGVSEEIVHADVGLGEGDAVDDSI